MRTTIIGGDIETTVLGFGCASLFHLPSRKQRRRILDAAYDVGIRHYDVAPMYGLGIAEQELGAFARAHQGVVLATKFGIEPTVLARGLARLQGPVRGILGSIPALQRRAKSAAAGPGSGPLGRLLYLARGYDTAAARASLDASLRRLKRGHVDLYLLHDPSPAAVPADLIGYLQDARAQGLLRGWGVAGPTDDALEIGATLGASSVIQVPYDGLGRAESSGAARWPGGMITYGVLGRTMSRIRALQGTGELRRWSDTVGFDLADPELSAAMLMGDALRQGVSGVLLYSTTRAERVVAAARLVEDDERRSHEHLAPFRAFLQALDRGLVPARHIDQ